MARNKLDIQKRQHRERSQPLSRSRLGLLEKHSDYIKRAKDYHSKKERLKNLRLKASLKNQDEFYFRMINSKVNRHGQHLNFNHRINPNYSSPLDNDLVKLLKTQDFNYIKTCRAIEENKVKKLKGRLGSMIIRIDSNEGGGAGIVGVGVDLKEDLRVEVIDLIHQSTSTIDASHNSDQTQSSPPSNHSSPPIKLSGKKTIFVDSIEEVKNFDLSELGIKKKKKKNKEEEKKVVQAEDEKTQVDLITKPPPAARQTTTSSSIKGKFKEEFSDAEDQLSPDPIIHIKKLMRELRSRIERLRILQRAERELELKRNLMGKGSKCLKFKLNRSQRQSQDLTNNNIDLSWYDKLDRQQLIQDHQDRQDQIEKLNSGIKTGARVWKWKQERKR